MLLYPVPSPTPRAKRNRRYSRLKIPSTPTDAPCRILTIDCSGCWHVVLSDVSREEGWSRFAGLEASLGSLILTF
ncbi:hypothetical protein CFRS1_v002234 [Colletotrichum fructicola]|nr:hypothetical protein CFRS1_v002234 [Colletotrichum fructicola]